MSHLNSAYVNDSGQVMYKVETSSKFFNRVATTIKRALPEDLYPSSRGKEASSNRHSSYGSTNNNDPIRSNVEYGEVPDEHLNDKDDIEEEAEEGNECRFGHLAEITFNVIAPSVLRFGGQEYKSSQFFTNKAFGWYGRNRGFNGPDGIEYQWILRFRAPELVRVDSEHDMTPIARFHRQHLGTFTKGRPGSLEIFSEGMDMIDLIVITFVYIQKLRNDKERSTL